MKKAFQFIENLKPSDFDLLGYPTLKFSSDSVEVYFECFKSVRELDILKISGYDEMRFFAVDDSIKFVYTFYKEND